MRKALLFFVILGILFSASFASAGCFSQAVKWISHHVYYAPNYHATTSYYSAPRNTYYVPPQGCYNGCSGCGCAGTSYYPRGYYNVFSGSGYTYSGPVVAYD
ncbi:MAG: hypothetical protein PHH08_02870 [Candidatus ainarchaeum sp.]|nr:hypothetical protein [Candidatus ainarchaeum sp.]